MFQDALLVPERHGGTRAAALPIAVLAHGFLVLALLVVPLLRVGDLPQVELTGIFLAPPPPVPSPAPPRGRPKPAGKGSRIKPVSSKAALDRGALVAPVDIPTDISEEALNPGGWAEGIPGGVDYGESNPFAGGAGDWLNKVTAVVGAGDSAPIRAAGEVRPPKLVRRVEPDYPELARQARVEGVVILEATTDIYGRVASVKVLRSVPLLDQAAVDAVTRWVYEPMVVNGRPRAVTFTVTLRFELKRS
jgi:protein TonB